MLRTPLVKPTSVTPWFLIGHSAEVFSFTQEMIIACQNAPYAEYQRVQDYEHPDVRVVFRSHPVRQIHIKTIPSSEFRFNAHVPDPLPLVVFRVNSPEVRTGGIVFLPGDNESRNFDGQIITLLPTYLEALYAVGLLTGVSFQ